MLNFYINAALGLAFMSGMAFEFTGSRGKPWLALGIALTSAFACAALAVAGVS